MLYSNIITTVTAID